MLKNSVKLLCSYKNIYMWKKIKSGWMWFAEKIGFINSTIIISVLFFVLIGIYGLFAKFFRLFTRKKEPRWSFFKGNQYKIDDVKKEF